MRQAEAQGAQRQPGRRDFLRAAGGAAGALVGAGAIPRPLYAAAVIR